MQDRESGRGRERKKNRGTEKEKGEVNDLINDSLLRYFYQRNI